MINRKTVLVKTAQFCKKHHFKVNTIVVLFAIIILASYFKDFVCKILGYVFMPVRKAAEFVLSCIEKPVSSISGFYLKHRTAVLKTEAVVFSVCCLCLYIMDANFMNDVLGNGADMTESAGQENHGFVITYDGTHYVNGTNRYNQDSPVTELAVEDEEESTTNQSKEITENNEAEKDEYDIYYVKINRVMNTVTIYTRDENGEYTVPYKAMRCAAGKGENTPLGTFTIGESQSDRFLFTYLSYGAYGQYCTRIVGPILFHSSTYDALRKDSLSAEDYNLLGNGVSHGCIRLTVIDAKWIYDNCAAGTQVCIYDDAASPGPLGKPETIKVPEGTLWDPTDTDPANPWKDARPAITGALDRVVEDVDNFDIMEGITAVDSCGNDVTDKVVVEGEYNTSIPGYYTVTYKITDAIGRSDEKTVTITIK